MYHLKGILMKTLVAALALISTAAFAGPYEHHEYGHHEYDRGPGPGAWLAPLAIGGLIGYELSQKPVQIIQQPDIIYQQPVPATPPMQPVYKEVFVYQRDCNCYLKQYQQIGWR